VVAPWINRVLDQADPEQPWRPFRDGSDVYTVDVYPSIMPILRTQDGFDSLIRGVLYTWFWMLISRLFDRRWKVVVSRQLQRRAMMFHAVQVEFFESEDEADNRQHAIARDWTPNEFSLATPFTALELERAGRATRTGHSVPPAWALTGFTLTTLRSRFFLVYGAGSSSLGLLAVALHFTPWLVAVGLSALALGGVFIAVGGVLWLQDRGRRASR
jgi:hypothetical protein